MPSRRAFLQTACQALATPFFSARLAKAETSSSELTRYPYIQDLRSDRVTIRWNTLTKGNAGLEITAPNGALRLADAVSVLRTPAQTGIPYPYYQHTASVRGLNGSNFYKYRVLHNNVPLTNADEDLAFQTRGASSFRFLSFGDSGMGTSGQRSIAQLVNKEPAALVIHTGDLVYPEGSTEAYEKRYFEYYRPLMKRLPFFPCPGNHDYYGARAVPYVQVHSVPRDEVVEGDSGRYYSFDWGNAHFISLDSNEVLEAAVNGDGKMLEWLAKDLAACDKFWRIAFFHHPPYATGASFREDPLNTLAREYITPILEKYHVPLVLSGHEHNYQRTKPIRAGKVRPDDGAVYITTGGGGAMLYPFEPADHVAAGMSVHHFVRAELSPLRLNIEAIDDTGTVFDSFIISPKPLLSQQPVLNTADNSTALASGGLASIYGWQFAAEERTPKAEAEVLPRILIGVKVECNNVQLPLFYVSPNQVNVQLPFGIDGEATLKLTTINGTVETLVKVSPLAPAIFSNGLTHADGTLVQDSSPVQAGESVTVFLTGLGEGATKLALGDAPELGQLVGLKAEILVEIGGMAIRPTIAALVPKLPGMYQLQFSVPSSVKAGSYSLTVSAGQVRSNSRILFVA